MFITHSNIMADDHLIDGMIGFNISGVKSNSSGYESETGNEVRLGHTDDISELKEIIMSMKIQLESMSKDISALTAKVTSLEKDRPKTRPKTMAAMPDPDALRHTGSPSFRRANPMVNTDDDTESYVSVGVAKSGTSSPVTSMDINTYMNHQPNAAVFSLANHRVFKNNSATSSRGYDNKMSMWATALTSLLVAAMKRYIQKTGEVSHIINEVYLVKTYTKIVSELYAKIKYTQLPAVQSNEVQLLSRVFSRMDKNEVPESTAATWVELSGHTDGSSCMAVIESLVTAAKMVPEAMIHPISQLVENIQQPVVRKTERGSIFAIPATTKISNSPNGAEKMCMYMKKEALKSYVSRRLEGENPVTAMLALISTMKDTDLFDAKYLSRGRDIIRQLSTNEGEF